MKFSVLICTRNSARLLEEVLLSIKNQETDSILEIIIADYQSLDGTLEIAVSFGLSSGIQVEIINVEQPGKSSALTLGLDAALGDYIVILDDDNILKSGFIAAIYKVLIKSKVGCLGTKGYLDERMRAPKWFENHKGAYAIGLPSNGHSVATDWVWGAGSIIYRNAWRKLRKNQWGFILNPARIDHSLPILIGGEDVELSLAIKLIGYDVAECEDAGYIHKFSETRLNIEYLINNCQGVSASAAVHSIYRIAMGGGEIKFPKSYWYLLLVRYVIGCILRSVKHKLSMNELEEKLNIAIMLGVFNGYRVYAKEFDLIYKNLIILKSNVKEITVAA